MAIEWAPFLNLPINRRLETCGAAFQVYLLGFGELLSVLLIAWFLVSYSEEKSSIDDQRSESDHQINVINISTIIICWNKPKTSKQLEGQGYTS